jgi:hypothetical protein
MEWPKREISESMESILTILPGRGHSYLQVHWIFERVDEILHKEVLIISKKYQKVFSEVGKIKSLCDDWMLFDIKDHSQKYTEFWGISDCT